MTPYRLPTDRQHRGMVSARSDVPQEFSGKGSLVQIPPTRLICIVMRKETSNVVKVECFGCHLIMHSDDFTSKVTMR